MNDYLNLEERERIGLLRGIELGRSTERQKVIEAMVSLNFSVEEIIEVIMQSSTLSEAEAGLYVGQVLAEVA